MSDLALKPAADIMPWENPNYRTPETARKGFSAAFPNLGFYPRMLMIVYRAGKLANKGLYTPDEWVKSSLDTIRAMERCGTRIEISGLEHVLGLETPCVFVANHMSTLETFALPCLIQPHRDVTFVVKNSLLRYPYFGPVLGSRDPIAVSRTDLRADLAAMLEGGAERLARGTSLIVFPQGSRGVQLDPQHFNSVGVKIARKAGVPVVPVALRTDAWGNGRLVKDFGPVRPELQVHFKFGAPMQITGNGKAEHAAIVEFIGNNLEQWGIGGGNA